jgi:hypothetical protein
VRAVRKAANYAAETTGQLSVGRAESDGF